MNLPLNVDPQQILLHLFNFAILAGGLYLILYKPVRNYIEKREELYQKRDEDTNRLNDEACKLKEEYEQKLKDFESEADAKRDELLAELNELKKKQLDSANAEAEKIIFNAREAAKREHDELMADVSAEIKDLAITTAQKAILKNGMDPYEDFLKAAERSLQDE